MESSAPQQEPSVLVLPPRLDTASCEALVDAFSKHQGEDLNISAVSLEFLGALGAELLLRARAEWREAGNVLSFQNPSPAFTQGLEELGIPTAEFFEETIE